MTRYKSARGKIIGAIVVIIFVAIAAWWYFSHVPGVDFTQHGPAPSGPARPGMASTAPPPIQHPISEAQTRPAPAATAPLPPLGNSDKAVASALAAIPGAQGLEHLLLARGLVPHIVATVDALPRHEIGSSILPLRTPGGEFTVDQSDGQPVLGAKNYARYDAYMKMVQAVDARTLVTWYVHWYPLFQQAYRQLGYPHAYFNDRLLATINNMLAAPNARPPVPLVKTDNGHYLFSDPTWESLSVGQKLMIRIGPDHERALKAKLRVIRALLLGKAPELHPSGPANSSPPPASVPPAPASSS
ncbi:MAG TPA: DUF3014 domain-containing protein [Rhodanobacteraceae bacterium]|nr:DUF3014 domain-containing protein [Rhodanobacteraceae bacterium]